MARRPRGGNTEVVERPPLQLVGAVALQILCRKVPVVVLKELARIFHGMPGSRSVRMQVCTAVQDQLPCMA
ncbi:hypothetical protein D9M73_272730 [compost metagenome]